MVATTVTWWGSGAAPGSAVTEMFRRTLQGYENTLGSEHISSLDMVNNLGNLCRDQGKLAEAKEMYQRALQGYERTLGPEHVSTLKVFCILDNF